MGGWNIVYALINFAILAFVLVKFGKKMVVNMINGNRQQISDALDAAKAAGENAQHITETLEDIRAEGQAQSQEIVSQARERSAKSLSQSAQARQELAESRRKQTRQDALSLKRQVLGQLRDEKAEDILSEAGELLKGADYAQARKAMPARFLKALEEKLALTDSDRARLRWGEGLKATLTGAEEIDPELAGQVRALVERKAGTSVDFETRTEESLIGGLRLQLGDTVYDGSLSYMLSRLSQELESQEDTGEDLAVYFQEKLAAADREPGCFQTGVVLSLADGICRIAGLSDVMAGEMLQFEGGLRGMVMDIEKDTVSAVLLGSYEELHEGAQVRRTGKVMEVPVGEELIGRVVDGLGRPVDGRGALLTTHTRPVESPAPGIIARKPVTVPLQTGIKAIDALVPIGRGQRELIIGDRKTGKTAIAVDTIINQKGKDVICIYVAIGQKESTVAGIVAKLRELGAMDYSIVVSAKASDPAPMLYIAPYTGAAMGEYLMYQGKHVLIVYDDLSRHAVAYRELSLLLHRPPGREAYPGDVFYLHSRLLERAACLNDENGGGSMTALPIVETQAGDISAYIPTNVISITDGQIFLEEGLFNSGVRPAINAGLSVSRVGGAAQPKAMKQFASRLRMDLAQHRELESFAQFGSDLDKATRDALNRGRKLTELLKQKRYDPRTVAEQVVAIFAANEGYMDDLDTGKVPEFEQGLTAYAYAQASDLCQAIESGAKLDQNQIGQLRELIEEFKKDFS
ncbi:MAG: F0F1 ATP synthase subunit alpha [bacterium]|nr:F0F1 ATP synthase subunit alpha [bacterium]